MPRETDYSEERINRVLWKLNSDIHWVTTTSTTLISNGPDPHKRCARDEKAPSCQHHLLNLAHGKRHPFSYTKGRLIAGTLQTLQSSTTDHVHLKMWITVDNKCTMPGNNSCVRFFSHRTLRHMNCIFLSVPVQWHNEIRPKRAECPLTRQSTPAPSSMIYSEILFLLSHERICSATDNQLDTKQVHPSMYIADLPIELPPG